MSHVLVLCTDGVSSLVVKTKTTLHTDKYYRLPDSFYDGKLDWNKENSKRLAVRVVKEVSCGVLYEIEDVVCEDKCFGLQSERRLVKVLVPKLRERMPLLESVYKTLGLTRSAKLWSPEVPVACVSVETAHILREKCVVGSGVRTRAELPDEGSQIPK